MKNLSLIAAVLLLGSSLSFADEDVAGDEAAASHDYIEVHSEEFEKAHDDAKSPWSYSVAMEGRIRAEQTHNGSSSGAVKQLLTKVGFNYTVNDNIGIFGSAWARTRHSDGWTTNNDFVTAADLFVGAYYSVNQYLSPYVFFERYIDMENGQHTDDAGNPTYINDTMISDFGAIGVSGTLWKSGKHSVSYYAEYYFALGTQEGDYAIDFPDNFDEYGSETAVKYSYALYEHTSLFIQPTWYVYGNKGYSRGVFEPRFGISVSF